MEMTIEEIQTELQEILLQHPLTDRQRFATKSAIEGFALIRALDPTLKKAQEIIEKSKQNDGSTH